MSIERRGRFELEKMSTDDLDELRVWLDTYREDVAKALASRGGLFLRAYHPDFKIEVIKAIRGITGLGLKEAKYLSEAPQPVCVRAGTDWVDLARKFVNDLENVAVIEWRQPYDTGDGDLPLRLT